MSQDKIDRGELPATNMRQLSSAIRQNTCGAGIDLDTLKRQGHRMAGYQPHNLAEFDATVARLAGHLESLERKLQLAIEEEKRRRQMEKPAKFIERYAGGR